MSKLQFPRAIPETFPLQFYEEWQRCTSQKIKFSIKHFFSKCDQIRRKQRIWSHLLNKSLMTNFIFCAVLESIFIIGLTDF